MTVNIYNKNNNKNNKKNNNNNNKNNQVCKILLLLNIKNLLYHFKLKIINSKIYLINNRI